MPLEHANLTGAIIGAAITVHSELGPGFLESIYEEAMAIELRRQSIPFERQREVQLLYRSTPVGTHRLDLFVDRKIVVELKSVQSLADAHFSVVTSYLRSVACQHGLLLNFAKPTLKVRRVHA